MLKKQPSRVIVTLDEDVLTLSFFKKSSHIHKQVMLAGYKTICVTNQVVCGTIMQPHTIIAAIKNFAADNKLYTYELAFSNSAKLIPEQYVHLSKATPNHQELSALWQGGTTQSMYLFPSEPSGQFAYYSSNASYGYLFQLQLIGIALQKKITLITTNTFCLLNLYKYFKGKAFRQCQLAHDINIHGMNCSTLFNQDFLYRIMSICQTLSIDLQKELKFLLPALGLFLYERESDENN